MKKMKGDGDERSILWSMGAFARGILKNGKANDVQNVDRDRRA